MTGQLTALVRGSDASRRADLAIADECRLNVLWLTDAVPGDRALEIEFPELPLKAALQALYRDVETYPVRKRSVTAEAGTLPYANATFDLVTCYGRFPRVLELKEYRRVLRPGGTALLAAGNHWWIGRRRSTPTASGGDLTTLSAQAAVWGAGFLDVQAYWVEPSLAIPRSLIPARPDRVRGFEAVRAREDGKDMARSLAANVGLHQVIYPALVFVARK